MFHFSLTLSAVMTLAMSLAYEYWTMVFWCDALWVCLLTEIRHYKSAIRIRIHYTGYIMTGSSANGEKQCILTTENSSVKTIRHQQGNTNSQVGNTGIQSLHFGRWEPSSSSYTTTTFLFQCRNKVLGFVLYDLYKRTVLPADNGARSARPLCRKFRPFIEV